MTELPETTVFINDALAIDPAGCGCTDCIVCSSIPADETDKISEAIEQHFIDYREIINRTGGSIVLYRNAQGDFDFDYLYSASFGGDTAVLEPMEKRYEKEYDTFFIHSEGCICSICSEGIYSVPLDNESKVLEFVEKHFRENSLIENHTDGTIVIGMNYGDFAFQYLPTYFYTPEVTVLSYRW